MTEVEKLEFASPEWMTALEQLLTKYAKEVPASVELTICEIFTNIPEHLDTNGDGICAWHCRITNGQTTFQQTAIAEADVLTEIDYQFALRIARQVYTPEIMAEIDAYRAQGIANGKLKVSDRNRGKVPKAFTQMHNELALRTQ